MDLKPNKIILILFLCFIFNAHSQIENDYESIDSTSIIENVNDTFMPQIETSYYNENLHYNDSSKNQILNSEYHENLNKTKWKKEIEKYKFEEIKKNEKPEEDLNRYKKKIEKNNTGINIKYIFYFLAIGILIFLLIKIIPNKWNRNIDIDNKLKFEIDNLDHESIKQAELTTPLNLALNSGNYKEAYRIKYLQVLQMLIKNNLIYYSKEKTNYDYLLQLNSNPVYHPFKKLTLNFDGIWYGDNPIDEKLYHSLMPFFNEFDNAINTK